MALDLDLGLTPEQLGQLGADFRGCRFTSEPCQSFLQATESCDVQAAPGSGKTTLLVAKLLHARRRWRNRNRGVCVVSHTNAARREVEDRLSGGEAADLLSYPNFVGTLTKFINQFIALPFLRGLGWSVTVIDDDIHEARAIRLARHSLILRKQPRKADQFARLAAKLTLDRGFVPGPGPTPDTIAVADQSGLPKVGTQTRIAFEKIKGRLVADGVFRYSDLSILAEQALNIHPFWAEYLADRFPLVLVDEVQDSQGVHLRILDRVFQDKSCIQRLGDCNQTIYDTGGLEDHWTPSSAHIDLGHSLRFGRGIARFASKLTLRRKQEIGGLGAHHELPVLLTFPEGGSTMALDAFAQIVAAACPQEDTGVFWVVAGRHRPAESASGMSLTDYDPSYRAPTSGKSDGGKLHAVFRDAAARIRDGDPMSEHWSACIAGVGRLLRIQCGDAFRGRLSSPGILRRLEELSSGAGLALRSIVHGHLTGSPAWSVTRSELLSALHGVIPPTLSLEANDYLEQAGLAEPLESGGGRTWERVVSGRKILLRLGSIASVKGQTHDATLVVQTKTGRTSDVQVALNVAAGHRQAPKSTNTELLKAITNVFVGATRPRRLLCFAMPEADLSPELRTSVESWDWKIQDCASFRT